MTFCEFLREILSKNKPENLNHISVKKINKTGQNRKIRHKHKIQSFHKKNCTMPSRTISLLALIIITTSVSHMPEPKTRSIPLEALEFKLGTKSRSLGLKSKPKTRSKLMGAPESEPETRPRSLEVFESEPGKFQSYLSTSTREWVPKIIDFYTENRHNTEKIVEVFDDESVDALLTLKVRPKNFNRMDQLDKIKTVVNKLKTLRGSDNYSHIVFTRDQLTRPKLYLAVEKIYTNIEKNPP